MQVIEVDSSTCGVEVAGELTDFINEDLKRLYPERAKAMRVTLIEAKEVLGSFDASLREYAASKLTKRGVVLLKGVVKSVEDHKINLQGCRAVIALTLPPKLEYVLKTLDLVSKLLIPISASYILAGEGISRRLSGAASRGEHLEAAVVDGYPLTTSVTRQHQRGVLSTPLLPRINAGAIQSPLPGSAGNMPRRTARHQHEHASHPLTEAATAPTQPRRLKRKQEQYHKWQPRELEVLKTAFELAAKRKRLPNYNALSRKLGIPVDKVKRRAARLLKEEEKLQEESLNDNGNLRPENTTADTGIEGPSNTSGAHGLINYEPHQGDEASNRGMAIDMSSDEEDQSCDHDRIVRGGLRLNARKVSTRDVTLAPQLMSSDDHYSGLVINGERQLHHEYIENPPQKHKQGNALDKELRIVNGSIHPTLDHLNLPPPEAMLINRPTHTGRQTPLRTQVQRILGAVGGEGTVDEVVEELMVEERWANIGAGNLRRRVAAVMSTSKGKSHGAGGGLVIESSTAWRSADHKRIVYCMR
ncbi:hypothetical protein CEUSTIGMA_g5199.t1 [Chlamydomonas eustigma]|uniref:Uncharacterized protein n=1 Tax=Chlamydomonas eustigma TaxID=1157962 RepID=A0A250X3X4_9CHLO|nr:hypothetical protein CEUSTIGMA_g5199.t1 [Chlamydomonas eustigma]|eukprot:GAX77756.1 hypothetical protein CEUSTIGMA_g5199.t1 [Chlamydomonas eustigma]